MVGDDIQIVVIDIHGDKVKLAIAAPRDVTVLREELVRKQSAA